MTRFKFQPFYLSGELTPAIRVGRSSRTMERAISGRKMTRPTYQAEERQFLDVGIFVAEKERSPARISAVFYVLFSLT